MQIERNERKKTWKYKHGTMSLSFRSPMKHEQLYAETILIKEDQSIHYLISEKTQEKKAA